MSLVSVPAIYDGKTIRLLETVSIKPPYRVVATFLEPIIEQASAAGTVERFWASCGAWQDEEKAEDTVKKIYDARRSKAEPPESTKSRNEVLDIH